MRNKWAILRALLIAAFIFLAGMLVISLLERSGLADSQPANLIDSVEVDGWVYTLESRSASGRYADYLAIDRRETGGGLTRVYERDFKELMPWKIETADLDGDGQRELLIAVHKATHYDAQARNRMFIFNYRDGVLVKKWTGSQIAGDWDNFTAGELLSVPGEELLFLERVDDHQYKVHVYYWLDFGFALLASSDPYADVQGLEIAGENRLILTQRTEGQVKHILLRVNNGRIVESGEE